MVHGVAISGPKDMKSTMSFGHETGRRESGNLGRMRTPSKTKMLEQILRGIGDRMRWSREAAGHSISEMARLIKYDQGNLSKMEFGQKRPTIFIIRDYSNRCGVDPGFLLFGGESYLERSNPEVRNRLIAKHPEVLAQLDTDRAHRDSVPALDRPPQRARRLLPKP